MTFSVCIQPSGRVFEVAPAETILSAALRAGIGLPYGCKNGACGSCKGKVLEGSVVQGPHQLHALTQEESTRGFALFCSSHPESDLVLEVREVAGVGDIPIKKLPCRVAALEHPAEDVAVLRLQLPATERFQYLAGQYIELILKDGRRRSYSMAAAPQLSDQLELHIRHIPGGAFTDHVFGVGSTQLKLRDILRFEGPFGTFTLREESGKPVIFLASGTGFAPIKAMVESQLHKTPTRSAVLYWGGRRPADLYSRELARSWEKLWPGFRFVPVVSDATTEDQWRGRSGFVHRAVLEDYPDLQGYQVYACGSPIVVDSARRDFVALRSLPEEEFYADAFTTEADLAAQPVVTD